MCEILRIYSYVMSINELDGRWDAHESALHEWPLSDRSWEGRLLHCTTAAARSEEKREKREDLTIARDVKTWEKHVWRHLERVLKRNGAIQLHYACILTVRYCTVLRTHTIALRCTVHLLRNRISKTAVKYVTRNSQINTSDMEQSEKNRTFCSKMSLS